MGERRNYATHIIKMKPSRCDGSLRRCQRIMAGNILIVDNDREFLQRAVSVLDAKGHHFPYHIFTAESAFEAKELLQSVHFVSMLYSIRRPPAEGLELLAHMMAHCTDLPFIAVWDFGGLDNPAIPPSKTSLPRNGNIPSPVLALLGNLGISTRHCLYGLKISNYFRLAELERKTCLMEIDTAKSSGKFVFIEGQLMNAVAVDIEGDDAVYEVLGWTGFSVTISEYEDEGTLDQNVFLSLDHNLKLWETFSLEEKSKYIKERREETTAPVVRGWATEACSTAVASDVIIASTDKEDIMAIEKHLNPLKEIKGFKAAGIMNYTGEVVAYSSVDPAINLELVGATFNDIFRSAHEASKKIGLDACKETVIMTPKGTIVMACSGVDAKVHIHAIGILEADGNQALMKMQLEKMIPAVVEEL
jgi:predicted regulator of Ras-like GTPase activity (Roadblock/LC7/MglB family)